jgi:hypothetical protein
MNLESRGIKVQQDVPDGKLQGFADRIPELASNPNNVESVCGRSDPCGLNDSAALSRRLSPRWRKETASVVAVVPAM